MLIRGKNFSSSWQSSS